MFYLNLYATSLVISFSIIYIMYIINSIIQLINAYN